MMDRIVAMPKSYKNNNSQQKIKIFLAEVKELIKLFACTPSFTHRTKMHAVPLSGGQRERVIPARKLNILVMVRLNWF